MPLTIALAAVALVKNIREGCELYKQAKESFVEIKETYDEVAGIAQEVHGFIGPIIAFFKGKSKPAKPPAVAARAKNKPKYVAVDETKIKADIVKHLSEFFTLQEKLAAKIRLEEEQSKTVYDPDQNHNIAAMNRVLALQQMSELEVEIREIMVYQTPGMGALYSEVFKMREVIKEEQEKARLAEEAQKRQERWQLRQEQRDLQAKLAAVVVTSMFLLYLWLWLLLISRWSKS
jgi:hypothetical protein